MATALVTANWEWTKCYETNEIKSSSRAEKFFFWFGSVNENEQTVNCVGPVLKLELVVWNTST